jgi:protein-disulfide isomerase
VLYFAYVSFFVLETVCLLCVATYVAVIGLFIISGSIGPARLASLPADVGRDMRRLARNPVALTIALLYIAGAASAVAFFPRERGESQATAAPQQQAAPAATLPASDPGRQQFEAWLAAQPRVPLTIPNDGAKVLIVKFNDYQCPPCRQTFNEYAPIIARYVSQNPGQVKFITKDFPLEAECNTGGVHEAGCEAAAAVRMARVKSPERADELERWIFDNQPAMSPALVRRGVREVGGVSDFDAQYPKVLEQVRADVALGRQLGVSSTPTFFINGVKIVGGLRPQFFDVAIAAELARGNDR